MKWFSGSPRDRAKPAADISVPPLSKWERRAAALIAFGGAAVGGLGFYASFDAVSAKAVEWGFDEPWVLPTAIDSAIPVFTGAYLLLIRMGMGLAWARLIPWALSLVTCALNVAAGDSLWAKVAHGAMSLLWVAVSEIAAHIYAVRIGAATGKKMDKVRRARWILSLGPTFLLWRRMKLWELRSYDEVLQLEQQRIVYQALLRGRFGRAWRRKAPVESLLPLRLVNAGVPLAESAPAGLRSAGIKPSGIFASPAEEVPMLPPPARASTPTPALAGAPATAAPAIPAALPVTTALSKPPPATATVPPRSQPQPQGQWSIPSWSTEDELYEIVKDVLDNGRREVFLPGGPLTGAEIARVLQQSEGNGRKVRQRLIKTYAAKRNVDLQPKATINQVLAAFAQPLTAVSP